MVVCIDGCDKGGTFLGELYLEQSDGESLNLGQALLQHGLAKLHPMFDVDKDRNGQALMAAQQGA